MENKISNFQFAGEALSNRNHVFKLYMDGQLKIGLKIVEDKLIHVVMSDAHHAEYRLFELGKALEDIEEKLGQSYADTLVENAEKIFRDEKIDKAKHEKVN